MSQLMHLANSSMASDGTDIAFLNGDRQRYQYYGFVPAGTTCFFQVEEANVAHALGEVLAENIRFEEIDSGSEWESRARDMYCSRPIHFERKGFAVLCRSYRRKPYAILRGGAFIGYVVANSGKDCWVEACVNDTEALDLAVKAWVLQNKIQELQIILPEWENALCRHLVCYAAGMSHGCSVQARIFRFKRVIQAYLKVKADNVGISDGCMAFDIEGERFKIIVEKGKVSACEGGENPLRMTAYEANQLLLLPFPYEGMPEAPRDWFPPHSIRCAGCAGRVLNLCINK